MGPVLGMGWRCDWAGACGRSRRATSAFRAPMRRRESEALPAPLGVRRQGEHRDCEGTWQCHPPDKRPTRGKTINRVCSSMRHPGPRSAVPAPGYNCRLRLPRQRGSYTARWQPPLWSTSDLQLGR